MRIIVAKPAGVQCPSLETLETCFNSNPDGAGLMWADGDQVRIIKGFMEFDEFASTLKALGDVTNTGLVMHFRITTHGGTRPECCHPFPLTDDDAALRALDICAPLGVAHNGIITGMDTDAKTSDTMAYIRDVLTPLQRMAGDLLASDDAMGVVESTVGSKLAFLEPDGAITTVGDFIEDNGVFYSNASFKPAPRVWRPTTPQSAASAWRAFDEWDDEPTDGDMFDLIARLPYASCASCDLAEECALDCPYCSSESEAEYNSIVDYWDDDENEVMAC
ncbi:hypothetical protein [uncultured Slackia sp.]|uniref:hypothetical protein n=1 Tax=uncultured Slackia sp. TaxID=665903 RepID=UPI002585057C|nr:hypothetical protein [uncultured Slackia sp.]